MFQEKQKYINIELNFNTAYLYYFSASLCMFSHMTVHEFVHVLRFDSAWKSDSSYKEQKSPYNFFHILIFTNYLCLKLRTNGNIERRVDLLWTGRTLICCSCSHTDPFAFFIALPLLSKQKISMILRKVHRTRKLLWK